MKQLHRPDLFGWSSFDAARDLDFHSVVWVRGDGRGPANVAVDPLPLTDHDRAHLAALGGLAWVVITNSDHARDAAAIAAEFGARVAAPAAETEGVSAPVDRWLRDGDELVPGLRVLALDGSKTPGELALWLGDTLISGDLVRGHVGGALNLLPAAKLADPVAATRSIARLAALDGVEAVLVGDGWPVFRDGQARLRELLHSIT